jgi:putative ABC transport system substrate-binding protein
VLSDLAAGLVARRVALIVAIGNLEIIAAKRATSSILTVMVVSSAPVEARLIDSLARPGGNVTGTTLQAPEISGKFLELELYRMEAARSARVMGIELLLVPIRNLADLEDAFVRIASDRPNALFVSPTGAIYQYRERSDLIRCTRTATCDLGQQGHRFGRRADVVYRGLRAARQAGRGDHRPDLQGRQAGRNTCRAADTL